MQSSQYVTEVTLSDGLVNAESLPEEQKRSLLSQFEEFFQAAEQYKEEALSIVVNSIEDTEKIERASVVRKALKKIRVDAEKRRKDLKKNIVLEGKAIDGMGNIIKSLIVPLEEHLTAQEKFAENLEKERLLQLKTEREALLGNYVDDPTIYPLDTMKQDAFDNLLENSRLAHQAKIDREAQAAEEARLAEEQAQKEREELERKALEAQQALESERRRAEAERIQAQQALSAKEEQIEAERKAHRAEIKAVSLPPAPSLPPMPEPQVKEDALMELCEMLCRPAKQPHQYVGKHQELYFEILKHIS